MVYSKTIGNRASLLRGGKENGGEAHVRRERIKE